jgi:hypothetical protein
MKPDRYEWTKDPKGYKADGHVPFNRCFYCGYKFVGAKYAAFCNICDIYLTPDPDEMMFVVTRNDKEKKIHEGHWMTRRQLVATRIRIPDDVSSEQDYKKKLEDLEKGQRDPIFRAEFKRAHELI